MTQVCLLDSVRLSALLKNALDWNSSVDSIMVSAANGSILATVFRHETPDIKDLRTLSTTMTAAYTVASEEALVFEAQATRALSVIVPVADHILLAVNGPPRASPSESRDEAEPAQLNGDQTEPQEEGSSQEEEDNEEAAKQQEETRADLESVSEELAIILRKELSGLSWPHDI
jgi:hypothetical protein